MTVFGKGLIRMESAVVRRSVLNFVTLLAKGRTIWMLTREE